MACCLTAPSHYLNQCWLIIRGVLWHTSEVLQELLKVSIQDMSLKKTFWKIFSNPPGANELRTFYPDNNKMSYQALIFTAPVIPGTNKLILSLHTNILYYYSFLHLANFSNLSQILWLAIAYIHTCIYFTTDKHALILQVICKNTYSFLSFKTFIQILIKKSTPSFLTILKYLQSIYLVIK